MSIVDGEIYGTLHYVTGYTGFSSKAALKKGNFLALKFAHDEGTTTTVEIIGGTSGPVALDSDMNWVGRIADVSTQSIQTVSTDAAGHVSVRNFGLSNLVLEPESTD